MLPLKKFTPLLTIVLFTIGVSQCWASILIERQSESVSQQDQLQDATNSNSPINHLPKDKRFNKGHSVPASTMTGSTISTSNSASGDALVSSFCFHWSLSPSDKIFMATWMWRPETPIDDLFKIPKCEHA